MSDRTPADMLLQLEDIVEQIQAGDRALVQRLVQQCHSGHVHALTEYELAHLSRIHGEHFV